MPSATLEEYLETIYKLAERGDVRPTQIAEELGVSGPTVTATLKRLKTQGYITRPGTAVALTSAGTKAALDIIRRHRLAERFLVDTLGIPWEDVHEDACLLEHALSPRVQEALERFLDNPSECPHGHPIPAADGTVADRMGEPLSEQASECEAAVLRVEDEDEDLLTYLASLGMFPGTTVKVCDVAPFKGPMMVEVGGSRYALGRDIASKIVVEPRRRRERRRG
ncbi:MAG: metal-dependent transcriptional regulator [Anaerosomatales bacterium]|nr:metal-dependent transcriptional regulator [Anaerosomatales bacterium]